jgi:small subunit ribosomal protein S1
MVCRRTRLSESTEDFASMFEASLKAKRVERGQTIEGTIVAIGPDVAFVDVGGKGEATIEVGELKDDDGDIEVSVGDRIQAVVVSTTGGLTLSRRLARGAATDRQLEDAFRSGLPVQGKVEKQVKGGYEIRIGRQRAFCPFSQIDLHRVENAQHEGHVYEFRITEYKEGGRNIIVSRRALIEERQKEEGAKVRESLVAGAVMTGRIASVRDFGAFVDLGGGVQGLLHVSEMGWSRVNDPAAMFKAGEEITVKVLKIDDEKQKISLGLKQLTDDPWSNVATKYAVGQVHPGRVTRIVEFGAFVELEPGVEGLAHASTFPPTGRAKGWSAGLQPGSSVDVEVLTVDSEKKRIGVTILPEGSARASGFHASTQELAPGQRLRGKVERHEKFGVFVFLGPGRTGLIPFSETGMREDDIAKKLPVGSDVDVVVLEVGDPPGRRIRLSIKAIADAEEAAQLREYASRENAAPSESFGSLADKLRGALDSRRK